MNKQILKQKEKQEKKEKKTKLTRQIIEQRLLIHFQNHIGEKNQTSIGEIFEAVTGINIKSDDIQNYVKFYWWNIIEKLIKRLRKEDKCFIIKKNSHYFVLKQENEADYYKDICNKSIKYMEEAQVRADKWVELEKWKSIGDYINEVQEDTQEDEKEDNIIDIKIIDNNNKEKPKTKIIKLY